MRLMNRPRKSIIVQGILVLAGIIFFVFAITIFPKHTQITVEFISPFLIQRNYSIPPVSLPENVKAVHFSYSSFGPEKSQKLLNNIADTSINAVIITVKDEIGRVAFFHPETKTEVEDFVTELHVRGLYAIARLSIFQDSRLVERRPHLAIQNTQTGKPWRNYMGAVWADPTQSEVCEYNANIASLALDAGFDEINFDYVRFPTDGPMQYVKYSYPIEKEQMSDIIASCLRYMRDVLGDDAILSADVFGITFINHDVGIGQNIVKMAPYLDVISPMVYPSHYPDGFIGYENPVLYPYEIVYYTLSEGILRLPADIIVRPWYQDFDLGAFYGIPEIRAQIQAGTDQGIDTWFLWNARDVYTYEALVE